MKRKLIIIGAALVVSLALSDFKQNGEFVISKIHDQFKEAQLAAKLNQEGKYEITIVSRIVNLSIKMLF